MIFYSNFRNVHYIFRKAKWSFFFVNSMKKRLKRLKQEREIIF